MRGGTKIPFPRQGRDTAGTPGEQPGGFVLDFQETSVRVVEKLRHRRFGQLASDPGQKRRHRPVHANIAKRRVRNKAIGRNADDGPSIGNARDQLAD
jgi:hypothetical protein